jgi:hypothetical protein
MQRYVQFGTQGKIKESADDLGRQFSPEDSYSLKTTTSPNSQAAADTLQRQAKVSGGDEISGIDRAEAIETTESERWGTNPGTFDGVAATVQTRAAAVP